MDTPSANPPPDDRRGSQVDAAVRVLADGGVISVPTDTLYGLAVSAFDEAAVERLFRIKGRAARAPLPLLLADAADIPTYAVDVPDIAWRLAESFYPGPLTLVLRKRDAVPDVVTGGAPTVGVRVPDHWAPRAVVRGLGAAITGTSANRTGEPGLTTAEAVRHELGGEIDYVLDGGECPVGVPSTVLDISGPSPVVVREGAVPRREIEEVCGQSVAVGSC